MSYSWTSGAGLAHIGIRFNGNHKDVRIACPACGGHNFMMNTQSMYGKCFNCPFTADEPAYVAKTLGMTVAEARRWIEEKEGIDHNAWKSGAPSQERIVKVIEKVPNNEADDATKDDTYRAFLAELNLSSKNVADMRARCLCSDNQLAAWNYKTYPQKDEVNYFNLCKRLQRDGHTLEGVPGFFRCKDGAGDFVFHQVTRGIIMPQVNYRNQITRLHIRKDDDALVYREDLDDYEPKCTWFTSRGLPCGAKATAGVHYACDWKYSIEENMYKPVFDKGFCLTEGFMKADIIHYLVPTLPVIAVAGVNSTLELERELQRLKEWGVTTIRLAFDMDAETNEGVNVATKKVQELIENTGLICENTEWDVTVEENPDAKLKGLDDFLAYVKLGIIPKVKKITPKPEVAE